MDKQKAIMGIVGLVLVAVIGFNFDNITGEVTKELIPGVTAFPAEVKAGEMINIKVRPNKGCVDPEIEFHFTGVKSDGTVRSAGPKQAEVTQKGGFSICENSKGILDPDGTFTVRYRTELKWDGEYYAKVFYWKDRKTKEAINVYFDVEPKIK